MLSVPTYAPDPILQRAAQLLVDDRFGGVVKRAAAGLNIDYIMLRRFLATGRSKPENRQKVRNALKAAETGVVRDREISHAIPIDVTRSLLKQLLDALDAYQSQSIPPSSRADP